VKKLWGYTKLVDSFIVMDTRAYLKIDVERPQIRDVVENLRRIPWVVAADPVNSTPLVMALIRTEDLTDLAATLFIRVRRMKGVRSMSVYFADGNGNANLEPMKPTSLLPEAALP